MQIAKIAINAVTAVTAKIAMIENTPMPVPECIQL